jgi:hypothetical protein
MGKHNKNSVPTEKMFTLEDVDEMTMTQFHAGVVKGMQILDEAYSEEVKSLKSSFEDVWAVFYSGNITPEKQRIADQMAIVSESLATLVDVLADSYETEMQKYRESQGMTGSEFWERIDSVRGDEDE